MELYDLESGLSSVAAGGHVLNNQELAGIRAGLATLKRCEQHRQVYFWGKVLGQTADYYIAFVLKAGDFEFPAKTFYHANASFEFRLLEPPVEEEAERVADLAGERPLSGNPGTLLEPVAGDDEPPLADDPDQPPAEQGPKKLTEADRLALLVREIDFDTAVVPRGAFALSDEHTVVPNKDFQGLRLTEAASLGGYVHFRTPVALSSIRALARADAQFFNDFMDPILGDAPKGCWTLRQDLFDASVTLRSLHWPGYVAFHVPGTPKFGGFYVGYAQRNIDLPFMV